MWLASWTNFVRSLGNRRATLRRPTRPPRRRPELEALEDRLAPAVVGYIDDRHASTGPENYIRAAGHTPVRLFDADLATYDLRRLDALIIGLGNGSRSATLMANYGRVVDYVNQGGRLIVHDSNPFANAAQDVAPGLDGSRFVGLYSSFMNVLDPTSPIVNGPFGVITNTTLDNGSYSNHGYVDAATLPASVTRVMCNDGAAGQVTVLSYAHGDGFVIYSTVPGEYYAYWYGSPNWPIGDAVNYVYLPNELSAVLTFNHPPVAVVAGPLAVDEGQGVSLDASASSDLDGNALTFSWDLNNDGVWGDAAGATPSLTWDDLQAWGVGNDGTYPVRVQVSDGKDASVAATTLAVHNVLPEVRLGADLVVLEGEPFAVAGSFADPGSDGWSATVDFGDGLGPRPLALNADKTFSVDHAYARGGTYTVTVTVNDGAGSASDTLTVTVNPLVVDPSVSVSGPSDGVRGQPRTFTFRASSPVRAVQQAGFTFVIDWGDGSPALTVPAAPGNDVLTVDHAFAAVGSYAVRVTVTDANGRTAGDDHAIAVTAVALQLDPDNGGRTNLVVGGTGGSDQITFKAGRLAGEVVVVVNGEEVGRFFPTGRLVAFGGDGNDHLKVDPVLGLNAWLDGGAGDDLLQGGRGGDVLRGGPGDDVLIDLWGLNELQGGPGRNVVAGAGRKK